MRLLSLDTHICADLQTGRSQGIVLTEVRPRGRIAPIPVDESGHAWPSADEVRRHWTDDRKH
jgi:hypothetical protein